MPVDGDSFGQDSGDCVDWLAGTTARVVNKCHCNKTTESYLAAIQGGHHVERMIVFTAYLSLQGACVHRCTTQMPAYLNCSDQLQVLVILLSRPTKPILESLDVCKETQYVHGRAAKVCPLRLC